MVELGKRIVGNLLVSVGGKAVSGALAVASVAFTTRALGAEAFGEYTLALVLLYVFSVFGSFGLDALLTREISQQDADEKKVIEQIFFARFTLLFVFFAAGIGIVFLMPYSAGVKLGVAVASVGALCFSLAQLLTGVFQKYLRTDVPAASEVAVRVVQLALSWYLWTIGGGLFAFLSVFVLGGVIQLVFVYWWASVRTGFRFRVRAEGVREVMKKGWPLAASAVLTLVYFRGDTIILSLMHSARDVGIYGVAYKVLEHAIFIPIAFAGLVMPLLSRFALTDAARFKAVFQKGFDFLAILAFPFAAGGIFVAPDIVRLLAGGEFREAVFPLQILFVAIVFIFFGALLGNALVAVNRQHELMWVYGGAAGLNILANLYFIARYSYVGAAWVTAATELLVSFFMLVLLARAVGAVPSPRVALKALGATAAMLLVLSLAPVQHIAALVPLGAASYGVLLYLMGGVAKEDAQLFFLRREDTV